MKSEEFCLAKHFQVVGRRDLYVLPVAVDHRHLLAKSLHNRRVVGETLAERQGEGAAQEGETEGLWGLHNAVVGAQHVVTLLGVNAVLIGMAHIAQRVDDRQHRDGGTALGSSREATAYRLYRHQGAHTVVNGHDVGVGGLCQRHDAVL